MKSSIKIEFSPSEGGLEPVIDIVHIPTDDVRDKLVGEFLKGIGNMSGYVEAAILGVEMGSGTEAAFRLRPIKFSEWPKEAEVMKYRHVIMSDPSEANVEQKPYFSDARAFLVSKGCPNMLHLDTVAKLMEEFVSQLPKE